jgi:hypothetical protein
MGMGVQYGNGLRCRSGLGEAKDWESETKHDAAERPEHGRIVAAAPQRR